MLFIKKLNRIWFALCFILIISNNYAQKIISIKKYSDKETLQILRNDLKGNSAISAIKIVYSTINHKGLPTTASGLIIFPKKSELKHAPILIYGHGTTVKRKDVPSELKFQSEYAAYFASNNYLTIAPDYLGLGESPGMLPYLHATTEATATIDMIRAARRYFKDSLNIKIRNDIYITGYSQGGHAAMATQKYIQENNLKIEFNIKANAPCSGPYSLSKVMYDYVLYLNEVQYCDPEIMVHLIIGFQYVYGNLYKRASDYFNAPYDSIIKSYIINDCNFEINNYFPVELSKFIRKEVIDSWKKKDKDPFVKALAKNDIYDWKPGAPLKMYYSKADERVPYQNALMALSAMKNNGSIDVDAIELSSKADHNATMIPAMQAVLKWFNEIEAKR